MDDEHRRRTLPGGFLELVGPAPIIGHRPAFEFVLPTRLLPVRVVDKDDDGFSLYIDPVIIVPAALRRVDATARKTEFTVLPLPLLPRAAGGWEERQRAGWG